MTEQAALTITVKIPTPTATPIPTPTFTLTPQPTSDIPAASAPVLPPESSQFSGDGVFVVRQERPPDDAAGHQCCIPMPAEFELRVRQSEITFEAAPPWVTVVGELNPDGTFFATGAGTVAGRASVRQEFRGTITARTIVGDYTMGAGGELPDNQPITYHLRGDRVGLPPPTLPPFLRTFLDEFMQARRTDDYAYLMARLHPAALGLYGAEQCRALIEQPNADPSYNIAVIGATGPAVWDYNPDERVIPVQNVFTINANVTEENQVLVRALHFGWINSSLYWFTDCGEPLS